MDRQEIEIQEKEMRLEGRHSVMEAFRAGQLIERLFVLKGCQDGPVLSILREAKKTGVMVDFVPKTEHFREYLFRSYKSYSVINTLVQNNSMMELKEIYVPLTLRPVNSAYPKDSITIDGFPIDFFDTNHHVLITDMAGMGKSTITKRMFIDVVDSKYGIPIYIELRRLGVEHDIVSEIIMQLNSLAKYVDKSLVLNLLQIL